MTKRAIPEKLKKYLRSLSPGFTLVEIMISVLILGIGLTVVANSYIAALRGINSTANIIGALNLASQKLEALEVLSLTGSSSVSGSSGLLQSTLRDYNYTQEVAEVSQPENLTEYLNQVCLNLSWREQNVRKHITLSTYLFKQKQ
ncbi:MAG: prepilin-type N-terminal cleavage/methylation domain-containing protein [Candidatus Omnitrophica bacterium]|nr:prepilin-type N-terminal cleavage/methylation domain-containing protein [Candidatus Omnitrophota bacterium]MDD5661232.1 prepilin-type N-terminal cleavage/methylation domain-containing protein [Candidatus Omnitrophota bacterium]